MRREWKRHAKESMKQSEPHYLLIGLLLLVIGGVAGGLSFSLSKSLAASHMSSLATIVSLALGAVGAAFSTAILWHFLKLSRGLGDFKGAFSECFSRFGKVFLTSLLITIFTALWAILLVFPAIIAACAYSQALLLLHDNPQLTPMEAIRESKRMMKGHKWEYFVLQLSFIGWLLLTGLTSGILGIYTFPYIYSTDAAYYDYLRNGETAAL